MLRMRSKSSIVEFPDRVGEQQREQIVVSSESL